MKKLFVLMVISLACYGGSYAQTRVGGILAYGSEVDQWGLGINAEFFLNDRMSIQPNILLYFPEKRNNARYTFWELNGDFHYYFYDEQGISVYGLGGLNLLAGKRKSDSDFFDGEDDTATELGLNLGLGANFTVGNVLPFAELKYVVGDAQQAVISLGIKFPVRD
jgi:outer membrane immunogenic protein